MGFQLFLSWVCPDRIIDIFLTPVECPHCFDSCQLTRHNWILPLNTEIALCMMASFGSKVTLKAILPAVVSRHRWVPVARLSVKAQALPMVVSSSDKYIPKRTQLVTHESVLNSWAVGVQSRRSALTSGTAAAALLLVSFGSSPPPSHAAFGDPANIFGKRTAQSGEGILNRTIALHIALILRAYV